MSSTGMRFVLSALCALPFIAACGGGGGGGGGGGSSTAAPPAVQPTNSTVGAEGLWQGTTNSGRVIRLIVLENNRTTYFNSLVTDRTRPGGFIQGQGGTTGPNFGLTNAPGLLVSETQAQGGVTLVPTAVLGSISASYTNRTSMQGTVSYAGNGVQPLNETFTATYNASYETPANINDVVGTFISPTYIGANIVNLTLTVQANGTISATVSPNCALVGILSRHQNRGVYDVQLGLNGTGCQTTAALTGSGFYDASTRVLQFAGVDTQSGSVFVFVGSKQ